MKFFCEYCGNRIDAEKDHKCPNCGATYKKNKEFIKLQEDKKKNLEINNEYKQKIANHVLGVFKFSKFFVIIPVLAYIAVFIIVIVSVLRYVKNDKEDNNLNDNKINIEEIFESTIEEQKKEQEKITVNFNEFAETKKYKVKVEKYESVEDIFHKADSGYELVKFHLIVENLTTNELRSEDVNCIVDGIAQTNDFTSGYSTLPMYISRELAVKGTATFIVPTDAMSYDIRYGDYVTIHIQK